MEAKRIGFILVLTTLSVAVAAQSYDDKLKSLYKNTVPTISSSELRDKISQGEKIILLDTRTPDEYNVSHLPGAKFVDYDEFTSSSVKSLDKNSHVVVYCTVGYRSERIGEKLKDLGFKDVHNLYGGIFQWANDGGVLLNKREVPTDSVHTYSKKWSVWLKKGTKVY